MWGMKISEKKTNYIVLAGNHNRPSYHLSSNLQLKLGKSKISKILDPKLLGITLDPGITFSNHFDILMEKCTSKLNLIKKLRSKHYGIKPDHLLTIYKSLVMSLFNYSMLPYLVTKNSIKKKLQVFQIKHLKSYLNYHRKRAQISFIANIDTIETRIKKLATKLF
jgi:hypothetical protein